MTLNRREFVGALGAGWLADQCLPDHPHIQGRIVGASHRVGHLLRSPIRETDRFERDEEHDVVIVGSGPSGASAAWRLRALGLSVQIVDLEPRVGGTSTSGDHGVIAHPWGAHYLPVPETNARPTLRLLEEMNAIIGFDPLGKPVFDEMRLCHAPEERVFYRGKWYPGGAPVAAGSEATRNQFSRFKQHMAELSRAVGSDGREAFALPAAYSSQDATYRELDSMTMAQWLKKHQYTDKLLHWYVDYATRDDFGATLDRVSAWAAVHYFAARKLETGQTEGSRFLVWPEGNSALVTALLAGQRPVHLDTLVTQIRPEGKGFVVHGRRTETRGACRYRCRTVIAAIPSFVLARLVSPEAASRVVRREHSAWLVANLHVSLPIGTARAWDSILVDGKGLGYVDAGHQLTRPYDQTVWTYFRAYGGDTKEARRELLASSWGMLASQVLDDLSPAHRGLADRVERIDLMRWGHAMPRPTPGFLKQGVGAVGDRGDTLHQLEPGMFWAHVDQTGFALFEEANYHGVKAAELAARHLGVEAGASWL